MLFSARVGGIEFSGDEIRLAVVKAGSRRPRLLERHVASVEPAEDAEERRANAVDAVRALLSKVKNRPVTYNLAISSQHGIVRTLTIPFRGARKVSAAVRFELEPYLAIPVDDLCIDHALVLEQDGQTDVLAVAVRRSVVAEQLSILNEAGIDPEGVDIDAAALTGLWQALTPSQRGLHAALHVLEDGAVLALVQERTLVYFRRLGVNAETLRTNPSMVAREVNNSLRAFHSTWRGEEETTSLTLTGTIDEEALDAVARQLEIPVSSQPLAGSLPNEKALERGEADRWDVAVGAAMGAAGNGFSFSFRTDALEAPNPMPRMMRHLWATTALALLLLSGIAGYFVYADMKNKRELKGLEEQIATTEKEVEALQGQGINVPAETYSDPSLLDLLAEIAAKMPDSKVTVSQVMVSPVTAAKVDNMPWFTIQGTVKNDATWPSVVEDMKHSELFEITDPVLKLAGGMSTFKIEARRKQPAEVKQ